MNSARAVSLVGRQVEVEALAAAVDALALGLGGTVWIEGEPGIGKSAVVVAGLAGAGAAGCVVFRGAGQLIKQSQPLAALLECHRDQDADRSVRHATFGDAVGIGGGESLTAADTAAAMAYQLVEFVEASCVRAPMVLLVDDLQWADAESLLVWRRLAQVARQAPLLLVGVSRLAPGRIELDRLRDELASTGGRSMNLTPLEQDDVVALVTQLLGAPPGPRLLTLAGRAGGNPLYVRELIDAAYRSGDLDVREGVADLGGTADRVPASLVAAIEHRLEFLSGTAVELLRAGAVLGEDFSVSELGIVTGWSMARLVPTVMEAIGAGVLVDGGDRLVFRHGLIRQVLYESVPDTQRSALHQRTVRALAEQRVPVVRVAGQLLAAVRVDADHGADDWAVDWLADSALELAHRAPELAVDLIERVGAALGSGAGVNPRLVAARLRALDLMRRHQAIVESAPTVPPEATEPEVAAQIGWLIGRALQLSGRHAEVAEVVLPLLRRPDMPVGWAARLRAVHAIALNGIGSDVDTDAMLRQAEADATRVGDRFTAAYALYGLALAHRTDHTGYQRCLEFIERALAMAGDLVEALGLRQWLLTCRAIALAVLDRPQEAGRAYRDAVLSAERHATPLFVAWMRLELSEWAFLRGEWDEVLAELSMPEVDEIEGRRRICVIGLRAIIALHRDDQSELPERSSLFAALDGTDPDWQLYPFSLLAAWALSAERDGRPLVALRRFDRPIEECVRPGDPNLDADPYMWLPDGVRLALQAGDLATARRWAELARSNAVVRPTPLPEAVARHCAALVDGDPLAAAEAAALTAERGAVMFAAQAWENAAVLSAQQGDLPAARRMYAEAAATYVRLDAAWDLRRGDARMRRFGIRRTTRAARRPVRGWAALSPVELQVAELVAAGRSNPDIASELFVSAHTVRAHVSHILTKLDARSRIEIARGFERQHRAHDAK